MQFVMGTGEAEQPSGVFDLEVFHARVAEEARESGEAGCGHYYLAGHLLLEAGQELCGKGCDGVVEEGRVEGNHAVEGGPAQFQKQLVVLARGQTAACDQPVEQLGQGLLVAGKVELFCAYSLPGQVQQGILHEHAVPAELLDYPPVP